MAALNVKKGDNVMVITGKDKGTAGEVLKVYPDSNRVVVKGANEVSKHVKPRKAQDKGGIVRQEGTIDVSNVMVICPACHEVVRVKHAEVTVDGKTRKIRACAKCGADLDGKKVSAKKAAKKVAKKAASKAKDAE
ncbi:MAG: 50S ribosomal protein L24 [Eubacteriales bacterium]|nr:50S ribosomal protein L24 [Eubacteriales bacterium]MDY3241827.1 50S ribosomal protein L24 [Eubacteriales bacterium]MDY4709750.1 50S ribosomal protein L24 [Eubacteriales bacterium]MDY6079058.1 50S ribosomal protein L24 [Eubacteriales bacterium]